MFVRSSKYEKLQAKCLRLSFDYAALCSKWNELVERINKKGGEQFLKGESKQLSAAEIKKLLMLCHPDKHAGSKLAEEMTVRLLSLRNGQNVQAHTR